MITAGSHREGSGQGVIWDFNLPGEKPGSNRLLLHQAAHYNYEAGFKDVRTLTVATAVAMAEASRYYHAFHHNFSMPEDASSELISTDWGWWQINDKAHPGTKDEALKPFLASMIAHDIYLASRSKFTAWAAYNSRAYQSYMAQAVMSVEAYLMAEYSGWVR